MHQDVNVCAVRCCAVLCCAVLCCAVLWCAGLEVSGLFAWKCIMDKHQHQGIPFDWMHTF